MRKIKASRGFTLIELMVVVAIIGILAAVAVPKFLAFLVRSRKSEGRTSMTGVYNGGEAYFAEYEWYGGGADTSIVWRYGYAPAGVMGFYKGTAPTIGIAQAMCPPEKNGSCEWADAVADINMWNITAVSTDDADNPNLGGSGPVTPFVTTPRGFAAAMCGNVDTDSTAGDSDGWVTINARREPCNFQDDLTNTPVTTCMTDPNDGVAVLDAAGLVPAVTCP